ncbi:MAG TPA: aminopeptidase P family protein [Candidatus Baltobacteraceae bacterium]|jgi:Xaa-Pro aminopeptidase|nr:aminopeptidase P family protein [Candidatus Baltobacteraceae bacterium]
MDTREPQLSESTPSKASHDTDAPQALLDFMTGGWTDAPLTVGTLAHRDSYAARRKKVSAAYPGVHVVVPAGTEKVRANDTNFRFRPSTDFAYLAGPGEPGGMLVLEPRKDGGHDSVLFVPPHNRGKKEFFADRVQGELWVGRHRGVDESQLFFGVDRCRPIDEIETYLNDLRVQGRDVRNVDDNAELATFLSELRLIKEDAEIEELRRCVEISKRAFEDVIRVLPRAKSEREVEAAFWSRARIEANDVGYLTIAAAGAHACTLHWNHNHGAIRSGELLLLDAGVEVDSLYTADITRTLPISGKFTAEQRAVYDLVYAAQQAAMAQVKPGNDFLEPNRAAMRVLAEGLVEMGILKCSLDEAMDPQRQFYRRYTLHNVSHMLGMDVHDCAKARSETYRYGKLREHMVLTVEPGLYFQPDDATVPANLRGIGVRIEDDVVVTRDGCENLSSILPSRADDVEAWMSQLTAR